MNAVSRHRRNLHNVPGRIEIRDPLHVFVRLADAERHVLDAPAFQRLRHIHQLALTSLVYPGATHRRFEHSIGVMELASRIFDVVTDPANVRHDEARAIIPEDREELGYWRRVLRAAALCHDLGHLPFSHAAEDRLLPEGVKHEHISRAHILSPAMQAIWSKTTPPLRPEDVARLAVGPAGEDIGAWQAILAEIITGDVFGADRMDYLLRDSHHVGVAYGRFDHFRLIDTLRILPPPRTGSAPDGEQSREPTLGIEQGGVQAAEALLLARYSMFSQVYFHRTRLIYDIHLADYLQATYPQGLPADPEGHLAITDNEVLAALYADAGAPSSSHHALALRITDRRCRFSPVYEPGPPDLRINADAGLRVADVMREKFGPGAVRHTRQHQSPRSFDLSVQLRSGDVVSSLEVSDLLGSVPPARAEHVYVEPGLLHDARTWLDQNKDNLIVPSEVDDTDE